MTEERKAPKLRFPGFTNPWEKQKLGKHCGQLTATLNPQDTPEKLFAEYSMPAFDNGEKPDFVLGSTMNSARKIIDRPCLLINKLNVRKKRIWNIKKPEKNAVSSTEFVPVYSNDIDLNFLKYSVLKDPFTSYLEDCSSGSSNSQKRVTPEVIMAAMLTVPLKEEQIKIGSLLENIDNLITLHEGKCEGVKMLKKALLQKMFPKEGETVPEIRFPEFTSEWKECTMNDIFSERNERGNESLQILSVSIHSGVSESELDEEKLGKLVKRSEDKSTYKHVYKGDLVFNMMRAWQGAIGAVKAEGMVSPAYISAKPAINIDIAFLDNMVKRPQFVEQLNTLSYGVTDFRKRLYWDSFIKVTCMMPSIEEQIKIGAFFENLDLLESKLAIKCNELKKMKKSLLQQMFV